VSFGSGSCGVAASSVSNRSKSRSAPSAARNGNMAQQLNIDPQWIYRGIPKGRIEISMDSRYGCYLFPRTKASCLA
jgi:hypothetical protein